MIDIKQLEKFLRQGSANTYASGGKPVDRPEREGFRELVDQDGDWSYRDSYTGFTRSRGMELVRYKGEPVWSALYGGGMVEGKEDLAGETFEFLKKCMLVKDKDSFRGPKSFKTGSWEYKYEQQGDIKEFSGHEEIYFSGELVFFHRVIGGIIRS